MRPYFSMNNIAMAKMLIVKNKMMNMRSDSMNAKALFPILEQTFT
jgi:hypothetical protein